MARTVAVVGTATMAALATTVAMLGAGRAVAALRAPSAVAAPISKSADGHYWARAEVDGRSLRVLVDTGASAVALTAADARRLGLNPERLSYDRSIAAASGRVRAAPVTLDHVEVGGVRVERVAALVVENGLPASLLGMSYLGRLSGFSADRSGLTLTP